VLRGIGLAGERGGEDKWMDGRKGMEWIQLSACAVWETSTIAVRGREEGRKGFMILKGNGVGYFIFLVAVIDDLRIWFDLIWFWG
jgi:hypothetical protein